MKCLICGSYFKQNAFNRSMECEDCVAVSFDSFEDLDPEMQVEVNILTNPSGKKQPMIYEDRDNDTDSFSI
jgi:hypothetical protein